MAIIVTGVIGIGKTTVCEKVVNIVQGLGYACGGILTYKASDKSLAILDIRKQLLSAFLAQLGDKPSIFEVTISNRNQLPQKISSILFGKLP